MYSMGDAGGTTASTRGARDPSPEPHPQSQSPLFRIPAERRQQILEHYARDHYYTVSGPHQWRSPRYYEPTNIDVPTAGGYVFLQPSPVVPPTLMQIYRRLAIEARSLWFPKAIVWFS